MTIVIEMNDDGAVFQYPSGYADVVDEFDDLLDRRETGRLVENRYLCALENLVARHPWFIDGHAHIGNSLYDRREFERALEAYERGYSLGAAALPAGFNERIAWMHLGNRPFLRAAHGVALSQLRLGRRGEGIATMEKMLGWNPDDHQGIRLVIGSEYLRAGEDERAMSFFETGTEYPPYRYETALLLLCPGAARRGGDQPATRLRRERLPYIAEVLCGNPHPLPVGSWHGTVWAAPRLAMEYVLDYSMLWHVTPDAVAFLRWLHTHRESWRSVPIYSNGRRLSCGNAMPGAAHRSGTRRMPHGGGSTIDCPRRLSSNALTGTDDPCFPGCIRTVWHQGDRLNERNARLP